MANRPVNEALQAAFSSRAGTDRSASVGLASAALIPANLNRTKFFVRNDSANAIWINMGATAVAVAGGGNIKIAATGGYFEFGGYDGIVNAIAEVGAVNITAREF